MTSLAEWRAPAPGSRPTIVQLLPAATKEARRRRWTLVGLFGAIVIAGLVLVLAMPKEYTASTTLLVEETDVIQPLLEGRTVPTSVVDRAAIAREVAFSGQSMEQVLETGGWLATDPDPLQRAQLASQIMGRAEITNPRENPNLIRISYSDSDPRRAQAVTSRFGELIIQESLSTRSRESRAAFEFIDSQVDDYRTRLNDAEDRLAEYREAHPEVLLGDEENVARRISELQLQIDRSLMDQAEQSSQAGSWATHVAREQSISAVQTRTGPLQQRIAELQAERMTLAGTYTDQHPDMVRLQAQINDLQAQLERGGIPVTAAAMPVAASGNLDRGRLTEARSRSVGTASRIATGNQLLQGELQRLSRVAALGSDLANLTRDVQVNLDLYQDLLERRENARLSMNLDIQRGGLNFRVQEPAALPLMASSISRTHVALGVLALAIIAPLLLLLAWLRFDPRVRIASQIETIGLPVLGTIPPGGYSRPRRRAPGQKALALTSAVLLALPIAAAVALMPR
ncbi:XrtA system polysaccharide chain length determinant [Luteimonas sp. A277]